MNGSTLSALLGVGCACLVGCAPGPRFGADAEGLAHTGRITLEQARTATALVPIGRSELVGELGETSGVRFESGYEVLVYPIALERSTRESGKQKGADQDARADAPGRSTAELVVLVAPSGRVVKTRIRLPSSTE